MVFGMDQVIIKLQNVGKASGDYPYKSIGGGDGMQVQIDSRDNNIVYSGSQFGYYYRSKFKNK